MKDAWYSCFIGRAGFKFHSAPAASRQPSGAVETLVSKILFDA